MFRRSGDTTITIISVALLLIVLGGVFSITEIMNAALLKKPAVDIYEVDDWNTLKPNTHVTFELKMVWDEFYSEVETSRTMGIKTSERETGRGYMIPQLVYNSTYDDYEIGCFMGTKVSDYTIFNQMIAESGEWYDEWLYYNAKPEDYCKTSYKIDGKLRKMTKEEQQLMLDYILSANPTLTQEEAEEYMVPLMIQAIRYNGVFIPVGIGMIVVGAIIIVAVILAKKKKSDNDYYGTPITPAAGTTANADSQYYGPEGLAGAAQKTYQYGGTNTYGTSDVYSSTYTGNGATVDESTGLSAEFLQREQSERAEREREEANQRAMAETAAVYAANPLFGNEPAKTPVSASQSFSAYDSVVNPATLNQNTNNSGLAVDPSVLYGTNPVPPTPVQPDQQYVNTDVNSYVDTTVNTGYGSNPMLGGAQPQQSLYSQQPAYSQPAQQPMYSAVPPVQPVQPVPPVQPQVPNTSPVTLPSGNGQYSSAGSSNNSYLG